MKKILLIVLLVISVFGVQAQSRTITVVNSTSYLINYQIRGAVSLTGCSTISSRSDIYGISGGNSVTYTSVSQLTWLEGTPTDWFLFQASDPNLASCIHGAGQYVVGATLYCSFFPTTSSFFSCTYGVTINYNWTEDASGNVTCTIF